MKLYHVYGGEYNGQDLESLAYRLGFDEAIEAFCEKWGHDDSSLADYHVDLIHFYDNLEEAEWHQEDFGGTILEIDAKELEVEIDTIEENMHHPVIRQRVDKKYIRRIQ